MVVIDPTNPSPVGFNPLAGPAHLSDITADSLLSTFESIFHASWGVRTADILTASLLTLSRVPGANLLWLPPLLTDPSFRKKILKGIDDPIGVGAFWRQYDAKPVSAQATEIAPVLNKLRQLILRPNLRAVLGQSNSVFQISDLFTKRRIVIVNLNRGILGADASRLLGSVLIGQLWSETLARQRIPQTRRHIVSVFIDEAHDFLAGISGDLSDALAQARSLGVAFTLANQYLSQLSPEMRKSIETNARSKVVFGLAGSDATATAKHTDGLDAQDFLTLPKYQAYVNVVQDAQNTGWISVATKPAPPSISNPESVYAASHERYGVSAAATDQAIIDLISPPVPEEDEPQVPVGRVKR